MARLPAVEGVKLCKFLAQQGFVHVRTHGSHTRLAHPDGRKTTVPIHAGKCLPTGLVLAILRDIGMSRAEFMRLWSK